MSQKSKVEGNCGGHWKSIFDLHMNAHIFAHTLTRTHTHILQMPPHGYLEPHSPHLSAKSLCLCEFHCEFSFRLEILQYEFFSIFFTKLKFTSI